MNLHDSPLTMARIAELEKENGELRAKWMHADKEKHFLETQRTVMEHDMQGLRSNLDLVSYDLALLQIETKKSEYAELEKENDRLEKELHDRTLMLAEWGLKITDLYKLYYELILAVGMKFEGESRHETALRYIRHAEDGNKLGQVDLSPKERINSGLKQL